jgi:branched-chain amino acid transport system ATP-binding protein
MTDILRVSHLSKHYGEIKVIRDLSFGVREGEVFVVIGPNGAGKTTMFRALTGESDISGGSVIYAGREIGQLPVAKRVRLGLGRSFQVARIYLESTVRENVQLAIEARERSAVRAVFAVKPAASTASEAEERMHAIGLFERADVPGKFLSHGDKKRLEFAMLLALKPKILMLDEPTAGMSTVERRRTVDLLKQVIKEQNLTMLLTEHDMDVVFELADRILVLNQGECIALGTPDEIRASAEVREVYLGQETHLA